MDTEQTIRQAAMHHKALVAVVDQPCIVAAAEQRDATIRKLIEQLRYTTQSQSTYDECVSIVGERQP